MKAKLLYIVVSFLILFGNTSCATKKTPASLELLYGNKFVIVSMNGKKVPINNIEPFRPYIVFDEGDQIFGKGCNNFSGSFVKEGNTIKLQDGMAMTMMMCQDEVLVAFDNIVVSTLKNGAVVENLDSKLVITSGKEELIFEKQEIIE